MPFIVVDDKNPRPELQNIQPKRILFGEGIYDIVNTKTTTPVSLLVESLVQQLCTMIEPDPLKQVELYNTICEHLHQLKLIDETYAMGEFEMMRSQYQRALYQLVSIARGNTLPIELDSMWPLTQPLGLDWSRYHRDFEEIGFIAGGGFGKVFKARHKLDGIVYAIKKITIRSTSINNVLLHLTEVKTLASLNHQNIVPYKAAWLEPYLAPQQAAIEAPESSSEDESDTTTDSSDTTSQLKTNGYGDSSKCDNSSSDFIQFADSNKDEEPPASPQPNGNDGDQMDTVICKYRDRRKKISIEKSQPHVKLKWATLYIQTKLCHLTLKDFLDARNKSKNYEEFYAQFIRERRQQIYEEHLEERFHAHISKRNGDLHYSQSFESHRSSRTCSESDDSFERSLVNENPTHLDVVTDIFTQLLNGLAYIHSRKIVHHDIKPSNIFVSVEPSGKITVQLGDFGLSCPLQEAHTGAGFGTPLYAAPEQLAGECNFKSDIYSLGIILLELLVPFSTDMERASTIKAVRTGHLPSNINVNFRSLLKQCIMHRPSKRPDVSQLIEIMNKLSSSKDHIITELQRRLSERDFEITAIKQQMEVERRQSKENRRSGAEKDQEIESLKAKIVQLQNKDSDELKARDEEINRLRGIIANYGEMGEEKKGNADCQLLNKQ